MSDFDFSKDLGLLCSFQSLFTSFFALQAEAVHTFSEDDIRGRKDVGCFQTLNNYFPLRFSP